MEAPAAIRPAVADDAGAAYRVLVDAHRGVYPEPELTAGMFANLLAIGSGHVAESADGIVGAAVVNRDFGRAYVLRTERRRWIGTRLLEALERDAATEALRFATVTLEPAAAPFLTANGYRRAREVWLMGIDLADEPPAPAWPDGIAVRTFREEDAPAVKALLDEAYSDGEPDYVPLAFEDWRTFMLGDTSYDPGTWFLATEGDEIVAAALTWKEGYVKDLVVSPRRRRLGLGRALMLQVLREFRRRGVPRVTLKTDSTNPTQAVRLYEHLGMTTERTYEVFEKLLRREE
jgi:mycothiol synthase